MNTENQSTKNTSGNFKLAFQMGVAAIMAFLLCFTSILSPLSGPTEIYADSKPYLITVNLTQNIVTVYDKDTSGAFTVPVQAFYCSVGDDTPTGTYGISDKYTWRALFGNVYGQYATRITGHILFHSVPYEKPQKDKLEHWEYNKLGTKASMGCIRLRVKDAKWIYDNCGKGTQVKLFKSDAAEPLAPEKPVIIDPNDPKRGWDPTDPDMYNPWLTQGVWVNGTWRAFRAAYVSKGGETVRLSGVDVNGSNYMTWDQLQKLFMDTTTPPENALKEGDYYQLRSVAEQLGYKVGWNNDTKMVTLS